MKYSKFLSRKFLMAVAAIIIDIVVGLEMDVDPEVITGIAGAIAIIYASIEGVLDSLAIKNGK